MKVQALASILTALLISVVGQDVRAQGMGEGAIVTRDTSKGDYALIYRSEEGDKTEATAEYGDAFGGITTFGLTHQYQFERKNGRVHIIYLSDKNQTGMERTAWMDEKDLAVFTYQCGCGKASKRDREATCSPLKMHGFATKAWNTCFEKGKAEKIAQLKAPSEGRSAVSAQAPSRSDKALTNDDVLTLVKVGLGDEVVIAKIKQAPSVQFNTSVEELVRLQKEGASKAVIETLVKRAGSPVSGK